MVLPVQQVQRAYREIPVPAAERRGQRGRQVQPAIRAQVAVRQGQPVRKVLPELMA